MKIEELKAELLEKIVDRLGIEDDLKDYNYDLPLFDEEEGLGLDSVDVLELFVILKKDYGIQVQDGRKDIFESITTIAEFIYKEKNK